MQSTEVDKAGKAKDADSTPRVTDAFVQSLDQAFKNVPLKKLQKEVITVIFWRMSHTGLFN